MNLSKLFEMQAKLDARIEREHPRRDGEDRLAKKILALQVELGELAQNWRGFKYWSDDRKPNLISFDLKSEYKKEGGVTGFDKSGIRRVWIDGVEIPFQEIDEYIEERRPLLEEYVDCLHFVLSIGLQLKDKFIEQIHLRNLQSEEKSIDITKQFNELFATTASLYMSINDEYYDNGDRQGIYEELFERFLSLGKMLGFTPGQIEQAYMDKNKINHVRQENGY